MTLRHGNATRDAVLALWQRNGGDATGAARVVGVSDASAKGWVRESGGVIRIRKAPSGHRLSLEEREVIEEMLGQDQTQARIAQVLERDRSTISRELARHRRSRGSMPNGTPRWRPYRARIAQLEAEGSARRPKPTKLSRSPRLVRYVTEKMSGPSRLSPVQVSHALQREYPDDEQMRISHETIYAELYVQGRGHLRADLHKALRTGRARRAPRSKAVRPRVPGELLIANRPKDVDGRTVPGHWEGDLIVGPKSRSAIGTLVERHSRFVILLHLPERHDAESVADQIAAQMAHLPAHLARSLTWDQGAELVGSHHRVAEENHLTVWFCDPASPWQRGTNENTNGLLRQYFPKGSDLSVHTADDLAQVAAGLNARPRETLGWLTPAEVLADIL